MSSEYSKPRADGMKRSRPIERMYHRSGLRAGHLCRDALDPRCISAAARREKVSNIIRRGSAPETIRCATQLASVLVLPEPAPAMMRSGGASSSAAQPCSTARRCSALSLARYVAVISHRRHRERHVHPSLRGCLRGSFLVLPKSPTTVQSMNRPVCRPNCSWHIRVQQAHKSILGWVRMSLSEAWSRSSSVAMTGRRPTNSGIRPYLSRSSGSTSRKISPCFLRPHSCCFAEFEAGFPCNQLCRSLRCGLASLS